MSRKRARSPSPTSATSAPDSNQVWRSEPIVDRASTFLGLFSPVLSVSALAALPELEGAHHRMNASRRSSRQQTLQITLRSGASKQNEQIFDVECEDDGEKYGGKRCEKVLEAMNVEGSVVVARWYGGVLLGPVRFAHIDTCARGAVRAWQHERHADGNALEEGPSRKRVWTKAEESAQVGKLAQVLRERDTSIDVLRTLLVNKTKAQATGETSASQDDARKASDTFADQSETLTQPTPKKIMNYDGMTVEALRRLERARDATIGFILKQIDMAEKKGEKAG